MKKTAVTLSIIFTLLFTVFLTWYGGFSSPMDEQEINTRLSLLELQVGKNGPVDTKLIQVLRTLASQDDGKEFYMINLMQFKSQDPDSDAMKAHEAYGRFIVPLLLKYGGHPVFMSTVQGRFLHPEAADDWHDVVMIRYRSRRDLLRMVVDAAGRSGGDSKWQALSKTQVFPVTPTFNLNTVRLKVAALLFILGFLLFRVITLSDRKREE